MPVVAGTRDPAGTAQGQEGNTDGFGRPCRVETDRAGERMGGVDERVHLLLAQPAGEALGAAEPADADLAGRQSRPGDASGE